MFRFSGLFYRAGYSSRNPSPREVPATATTFHQHAEFCINSDFFTKASAWGPRKGSTVEVILNSIGIVGVATLLLLAGVYGFRRTRVAMRKHGSVKAGVIAVLAGFAFALGLVSVLYLVLYVLQSVERGK